MEIFQSIYFVFSVVTLGKKIGNPWNTMRRIKMRQSKFHRDIDPLYDLWKIEQNNINWKEVARSFYNACGGKDDNPPADYKWLGNLLEKYAPYLEEDDNPVVLSHLRPVFDGTNEDECEAWDELQESLIKEDDNEEG